MKRGESSVAQDRDIWIQRLYMQEYQRMFRVAYRMTGDAGAAQDFVQDAFLLALLQQEKLSDHPSPGGWLMVTLRNLIQNSRRRERPLSLEDGFEIPAEGDPRPLEEILPARLPEADRELLIWRFEQNMSYREIAGRKGLSEGACRSRVSRAVARCRALLSREDLT